MPIILKFCICIIVGCAFAALCGLAEAAITVLLKGD